ncbi:MAG: ATP-binding protein [Candidatus Marinarcus sp.]|uniref:PAS domain-containing sensor histidine kinase n=1 Tax=Candidatus Marinarcus sp. TaxID=3100987 RepID=UPI003B004ED8
MNYIDKADLICDTVDNGIMLLNEQLEVLFWNKWLETRTQIKSQDIINQKITHFYPDINVAKLKRKMCACVKLNSPTFYTTEISKYFFSVNLPNKITNKIFKNMQQDVTLHPYDIEKKIVIVYVYDNTPLCETNFKLSHAKGTLEQEHKKVLEIKEKLEDSLEEFELLLNATLEAILLFDENNKCININDVGVELFGFKNKEEALFSDMSVFFEDKQIDFNASKVAPFEANMLTNSGEGFPTLIKLKDAVLRNNNFKILTVVDLSELKYRDKLIAEQSKMVAMGEMMGNIAHQWRQPLSTISTAASGIKLQKEFKLLTDEMLDDCLDGIVRSSMHLSQTINDFRDFIQGDKEMSEFVLEKNLKKDLSIVEGMLKNSNIEVILSCENDIKLYNYKNELTQAILNIIDNAKDAFCERNIEERFIFIHAFIENNMACIDIKDNADGIAENILDKVFEPYFTTKHQSQGTGLGLYMTHQIIEMSMGGKIRVKNSSFKWNEAQYTGANFIITLPLYTKE